MSHSGGTLTIAHRGDCRAQVENTLAALRCAAELGADAIEVDVRCTMDGIAVLHHDLTLSRLWGRRESVARLTQRQLSQRAPQVPSLSGAFEAVAGHSIPLVLDVRSMRAARAAYRAARRAGAVPPAEPADPGEPGAAGRRPADRAWFCGNPFALAWIRRIDPRATVLLSWAGPTPPSRWLVRRVQPTFFNPCHRWLDERTVDWWQARGVAVSTWTVDDPQRRERLLGWGVDAIISNQVADTLAATAGRVPRITRVGP